MVAVMVLAAARSVASSVLSQALGRVSVVVLAVARSAVSSVLRQTSWAVCMCWGGVGGMMADSGLVGGLASVGEPVCSGSGGVTVVVVALVVAVVQ